MSKAICIIFSFLTGAAAGTFFSNIILKKKYKEIADRQIADMEEYYQRTDEYRRTPHDDISVESDMVVAETRKTEEEKQRSKEYIKESKPEPVNYSKMYKSSTETKDEEEEMTPEEAATIEYEKNRNKPPKIISAEAAGELPEYFESSTLYFYSFDETLVDDEDEVIESPEILIGDALTKYDFIDNDEKIMFVVNYELATCFEVQKIEAAWE